MMSCKQVADRADAIIDGDLGGWEALQLRVHLAMCKGCSRFVAQLRATVALTGAAIGQGAPQHDAARNIALILAATQPAKRTQEDESPEGQH
jgi:anti-sigma factor RsiW